MSGGRVAIDALNQNQNINNRALLIGTPLIIISVFCFGFSVSHARNLNQASPASTKIHPTKNNSLPDIELAKPSSLSKLGQTADPSSAANTSSSSNSPATSTPASDWQGGSAMPAGQTITNVQVPLPNPVNKAQSISQDLTKSLIN